jgi:hypothetical protein
MAKLNMKGNTSALLREGREVGMEIYINNQSKFFLVKRIPGQGPEQRESGKTVFYPLIVIIILISYIFIKLLIKRTIPAKTGNGTPLNLLQFIVC